VLHEEIFIPGMTNKPCRGHNAAECTGRRRKMAPGKRDATSPLSLSVARTKAVYYRVCRLCGRPICSHDDGCIIDREYDELSHEEDKQAIYDRSSYYSNDIVVTHRNSTASDVVLMPPTGSLPETEDSHGSIVVVGASRRIVDESVALTSVCIPSSTSMDKLRVFRYRTLKDKRGDECAICLEKYGSEHMCILLRCLHSFHSSCLVPWIRDRKGCPICKRGL
jgi:hypothetical protein